MANLVTSSVRHIRPIKTIIFEVNGKRYEYDAERFLALLDWWKEYGHVLMDERMGEVTDGRP